jgi:hypothetical protein
MAREISTLGFGQHWEWVICKRMRTYRWEYVQVEVPRVVMFILLEGKELSLMK